MKYCIYVTCKDGFEDSLIVTGASERDYWIKEMIKSNLYETIKFCQIYRSGEYGKRISCL